MKTYLDETLEDKIKKLRIYESETYAKWGNRKRIFKMVGIDFEITVRSNYNSNEVLLSCIDAVRSYFNIDKWQINQPIVKADVLNLLGNITGVQSVVGIKFNNLFDRTQNYAENPYDLETATRKGIIYPSLDPSIFEIKFPDKDIKGKTTNY